MINKIVSVIILIFFFTCSDDKAYKNAQNIALTQYLLSCSGGSVQACKISCDDKCGVSVTPITSSKIDCVISCTNSCNQNCNTILLFLLNTNK